MDIQQGNSLINQGKLCPYCGAETLYVDSSLVYSKSYGMIYICRPCDAWVGVHKGTDKAKGRLANAELRFWKKEAHASFDPIWMAGLDIGEPKHIVRNRTYDWLSQELNLDRSETHIGFFDVELCKKVVEFCNKHNQHLKVKPIKSVQIDLPQFTDNRPSGLSEAAYWHFDKQWFKKFRNKFDKNFGYDRKKFCYTLTAPLADEGMFVMDFYPKADKVLIRKQNKWIAPGLPWLIENFFKKEN